MNKWYLSLFTVLMSISLFAQEDSGFTIKGRVIDTSGEPVIGAAIMIKGTERGSITDLNGDFLISILPEDKILVVSAIGFSEYTHEIKNKSGELIFKLAYKPINLDEVVVVGYGEFSRRSITASIAKISGEVLESQPISSPSEALKGRISGLHVVQTNNTPGGSFSMKIRGGSSITNSNAPLVLVDGVERSFDDVNPNDISSIDVLKDAASSAVYGARGSNGVILITTKRGGYEKAPQVSFETTFAYQEPETLLDFLNAEDYINILRPAVAESPNPSWNNQTGHSTSSGNTGNSIYSTRYYNEGDKIPDGWKTMVDPLDATKKLMFCDTDWQGLMFRPSLWQNHNIGVNGGAKQVRYSMSLGYTDDQGIAIATGYKKINARSNIETKITKNLVANIMFAYQQTLQDAYASQRNAITRALSATPVQMVYYPDGTPCPGYNEASETPIFYTHYRTNKNISKRLSIVGGLKWEILPGWTTNVNTSIYDINSNNTSFIKANYNAQNRPSTATIGTTRKIKTDAFTEYKHSFSSGHKMSAMLGYSFQDDYTYTLKGEGTGSTSDKLITLDASSETVATSTSVKIAQAGFFGRINYDYKNKYLLTLVARYDGSSKFMPENRWGFFPGASVGWVLTEEPFIKKNITFLDYLKLRGSYGHTGNNNIGISASMGKYGVTTQTYDGHTCIRGTVMQNSNLKWETTKQMDIGLEFGLFDSRIYVSADYYDKKTTDLLYAMSLPNTSGYSAVSTNLGVIRFWGYEMELTTQNIVKQNLNWETKFVISYNRNIVEKLPYNGMDKNRTGTSEFPIYSNGDGTYFGGLAEGEPLYRFYGYKAIGIYQTDEEARLAPMDQLAEGYDYKDGTKVPGRKFAGDYNWADRNGDGIITKNQDLFCLGVTEPPVFGSINNTLKFHGFRFNVYLDYAAGHSIHNTSYQRYFYATFSCNYALVEEVKKCWQKPGDVTRYAKFWANDSGTGQDNFNRPSNMFTYRGDYLCIREVSLSYNFAKQVCKKMRMQGLQITLAGNNLHYFTAVKGISPEVGTSDTYTSYNMYPPTRRYSIGLKVTF